MKIEIEFDVSAYEREADAFVEQAIGSAITDALTWWLSAPGSPLSRR